MWEAAFRTQFMHSAEENYEGQSHHGKGSNQVPHKIPIRF